MKEIKVCLRKKGAYMLTRDSSGNWRIDGREVSQEGAITELVSAVEDLGYWCQVAKDVLPEEEYAEVQRAYEYDPESDDGQS